MLLGSHACDIMFETVSFVRAGNKNSSVPVCMYILGYRMSCKYSMWFSLSLFEQVCREKECVLVCITAFFSGMYFVKQPPSNGCYIYIYTHCIIVVFKKLPFL